MPQEPDHFAAHAAKGVQAKLAAGIMRKPTKDPLRDLQGFVTLDEQCFPIDRFRHSQTMALQQEGRQGPGNRLSRIARNVPVTIDRRPERHWV